MSVFIKFCGATRTVTGSCFLVRTPECRFLVDCGLFQGAKTLKQLNYGAFPFEPGEVDFVLQTHAHIDHSGLLPKLVKAGFSGPVFMTRGTRDLLAFMLPDSGHIQEFEVEQLNRRNTRRGRDPVVPIYTRQDAEDCVSAFNAVDYERWIDVGPGVRARFWNAGHILGSASIEIEIGTGDPEHRLLRILFSGDIGPEHKLFHPEPDAPDNFDYVVCESTYGGRGRVRANDEQRRAALAHEVKEALHRDGLLLIPSFAVERTQELLADLMILQGDGSIPPAPVFLDSPLAIKATETFERHSKELEELSRHGGLLSNPNIRFCETVDESKAIARVRGGAIIMAASGMCDAGRVRHHLKRLLWQPKATVMLSGFQVQGTLGRLLADGAKMVRIMGEDVTVRARIRQMDLYSGHADGEELIEWIGERLPIKRALFLTHGDEDAMEALRGAMVQRGVDEDRIFMPVLDDEFELLGDGAGPRPRAAPHRLPPESVGGLDWHNDLVQFSMDLRDVLDKAADEKSRNVILRRMRRALEGKERR